MTFSFKRKNRRYDDDGDDDDYDDYDDVFEVTCLIHHYIHNQLRLFHSVLGFGILGDTSQHGNWFGFRNEMFNGHPVVITIEFASPLPKSGMI